MSKSLKKILVAGASLLMFTSVGAGVGSMNKSVHAIAYTEQHTGTLTHSVRFGRHFYRKGSPVYGAQSLGNPTMMYVYLGHDTVDQRLIPDSYYTNAMHLHHHHYRHHRKVLYQYQIRPHYSTKTYNRLFKRLVREMEAHGMHYDSSNETGRLSHKGRYIELTGTNTGVVTNGLRALWPDQALNLLHRMYRHTNRHYYRPIHRHHFRTIKKHAHKSKRHVKKLGAVKVKGGGVNVYIPNITPQIANSKSSKPMIRAWRHARYVNRNLMNKALRKHQAKKAKAFRKASLYDINMMKYWAK